MFFPLYSCDPQTFPSIESVLKFFSSRFFPERERIPERSRILSRAHEIATTYSSRARLLGLFGHPLKYAVLRYPHWMLSGDRSSKARTGGSPNGCSSSPRFGCCGFTGTRSSSGGVTPPPMQYCTTWGV